MGSKALLIKNINRLLNNTQQCKHLSSTPIVNRIYGKDEESALTPYNPLRETLSNVIRGRDKVKHDKDLGEKYITIESEKGAVGIVSGVPDEHIKTRTVRIYQPAKNAMQSGTNNIHHWEICFDTRERWENPLMGWCSSGDPLQATRVQFTSKEEAIQHCESMGWKYLVQKENISNPKPRSYGTNFSWNKRTRVSTK